MTNTNETTPDDFDLSEWFADAAPPTVSVDVATRMDLHGKLQRLKRRYETERRAIQEEASLADETSEIAEQYEAVLQEIADSEVTLYIRALTNDEMAEKLTEAKEAATADGRTLTEKDAVGVVFSNAIVAIEKPGKPYREVNWPPQTVHDFFTRIGEHQVQKIQATYNGLKQALPTVDADFLRKSSGPESGTE